MNMRKLYQPDTKYIEEAEVNRMMVVARAKGLACSRIMSHPELMSLLGVSEEEDVDLLLESLPQDESSPSQIQVL
jgi:hypothetical protein